jgi:hypothetical protein
MRYADSFILQTRHTVTTSKPSQLPTSLAYGYTATITASTSTDTVRVTVSQYLRAPLRPLPQTPIMPLQPLLQTKEHTRLPQYNTPQSNTSSALLYRLSIKLNNTTTLTPRIFSAHR